MTRLMKAPYSDEDIAFMRTRPLAYERVLSALDVGDEPPSNALPAGPPPVGGRVVEDETPASSEPAPMTEEEVREWVMSLTVAELQKELRDANLSTDGKKAELQERLLQAYLDS